MKALMFAPIYILIFITSSIMTTDGRSLRTSDQLMPVLFSSVLDEDGNLGSSLMNGQNRLLYIIERIMK